MNILFLTSRLPYPPNRGDRLRAFNFIKSLSRQHAIHLISFVSSIEEIQYLPKLKQFCKKIDYIQKKPIQSLVSVAINLWRSEPLQALYYHSSEMSDLIDQTMEFEKADVIYVHLFRMAQFVIDKQSVYRILDLTDVISTEINRSLPYRDFLSKIIYTIESPRIFRYERKLVNLFNEVWLVSTADTEILRSQTSEANIFTITNGIDPSIFHPIEVEPVPFRLIFTGHMGIPHNVDAVRYFAKDMFPEIKKMFPECEFIVAGSDPARSILELSLTPGIKILGYVEDLNYELNRSQIFVAPLRFAAGVQNKILEAMAAGIPVITTGIVNEGIGGKDNEDILIADTTERFLEQISRLFGDAKLRKKIGTSGKNLVNQKFSWDIVLEHINSLEDRLKTI